MKIRYCRKTTAEINNFHKLFEKPLYEGMRSTILYNIDPNEPPKDIVLLKPNYYGEKQDLHDLARHSFPKEAFVNNMITYITAPNDIFEDTVSITKTKYLVSNDLDCDLTALAYVYNNLQKGGSAIIACVSTDWENKGILEVMAHSFVNLKVSDSFIIAEKYSEKYSDNMISYIKYCFDSKYSIKLLNL